MQTGSFFHNECRRNSKRLDTNMPHPKTPLTDNIPVRSTATLLRLCKMYVMSLVQNKKHFGRQRSRSTKRCILGAGL